MNLHRLSQAAEWAVLAAVVAMHGAILLVPEPVDALGPIVPVLVDAQPLAAVALFLAWIGLGPGGLVIRTIPVSMIFWFFVAWTLFGGWDRRYFNPADSEIPWPVAAALAATALVIVIRLCGLRAARLPVGQPEPRAQFSIRSLLVATTLVAAAIGCLELVRPHVIVASGEPKYYDDLALFFQQVEANATAGRLEFARGLVPGPANTRQLILGLAIVGSGLGAVWSVLRPGPVWLRLTILIIALPTTATYLAHLTGAGGESFASTSIDLTVALAAVGGLAAVSVLPLRLMDFRLCKAASKKSGSAVPAEHAAAINVSSPVTSNRRTTLEAVT